MEVGEGNTTGEPLTEPKASSSTLKDAANGPPEVSLDSIPLRDSEGLPYTKTARKRLRKRAQREALWKWKDQQPKRKKRRAGGSPIDPNLLKRRRNRRRDDAIVVPSGAVIVIDCSFEGLMNEMERKSLSVQVAQAYGANRGTDNPAAMHLTGLGGSSDLMGRLQGMSGFDKWRHVTVHDETRLDVIFPAPRQIVYLSSEAEEDLDQLECDGSTVYVVGGLVDHNRLKGLTHGRAKIAGFKTCRLPFDAHLRGQLQSRKVISVNQCFEMLVRRAQGIPWSDVFEAVLPRRKLAPVPPLAAQGGKSSHNPPP